MMLAGGGHARGAGHHPPAADARCRRDHPRLLWSRRCASCMPICSSKFGIAAPRILVAGLNPHAGEGGHLGREEIDIIEPVLERLRGEGIDLSGPLPADTLFQPQIPGALRRRAGDVPRPGPAGAEVRQLRRAASTSRSACRSSAPRSTTAPRWISPAAARPTPAACCRPGDRTGQQNATVPATGTAARHADRKAPISPTAFRASVSARTSCIDDGIIDAIVDAIHPQAGDNRGGNRPRPRRADRSRCSSACRICTWSNSTAI